MTEQNDVQQPWGAPPQASEPPRWSWRKTAVAAMVAVGVTAGGGAAVYAASGATASDGLGGAGGGPPGAPGYGRADGGPPMGGPMDGSRGGPMEGPPGSGIQRELLDSVHAEFVVADGNGGFTTMLMQVGELTEAADDAITVRSADGFTQTYKIDGDTVRADVQPGDTVRVTAAKDGDNFTADRVSPATPPAR